jgi:hypothetical protein
LLLTAGRFILDLPGLQGSGTILFSADLMFSLRALKKCR